MSMLVFDNCEFENDPFVSCKDCIYNQECYPSDRDDPSDEFSGEPDYPDILHDDDFDLDDFDDDEHNQNLAYISSL